MPTTVMTQEIATPTSDHIAPGPVPAISNMPPLPPGPGPVPSPFLYISRSSTASNTKDRLMVGGDPVLVTESCMAVEEPGNVPARPSEPTVGADILTRKVNSMSAVISGYTRIIVVDKPVAGTASQVAMNVTTSSSKISQFLTALMAGMDLRAAVAAGNAPGARLVGMTDPVSAASGAVFDEEEDLYVMGALPVRFKRSCSSARAGEVGPLGKSGWTHAFHQWIEVGGDRLTLRDEDGTDVVTALPATGAAVFHRGLRIEIRRKADDVFEVYHLGARQTRRFEPLARGGRAVLRSYRNARDRRVELAYSGGRLARITAPSGRELRFVNDSEGRILKVELWARGGPWKAISYTYDAEGDLVRFEGAAGDVWEYAYDGAHRLVKKTQPGGLSFHYRYDDRTGRCVHAWGDGGLHEGRFEYDLEKGTTVMTGNPAARTYRWDERGAVTAMKTSDGGRFEEADYDADLHLTRVTDEHGEVFAAEIDERGNVLRAKDGDGRETAFEYREDLLVRRVEPGGLVTEFSYDRAGDLSAVKYPSGNTLTIEHDGAGRVASVHGPDGLLGAFTYDDEDNVVAETGPAGDVYRYVYDALGRVMKRTDPAGRTASYEHDAADRVVALTYPDGATVRYTYDALGRLVGTEDPAGGETRRAYAGVQAITRQELPDGAVWTSELDRIEQLRSMTNPRGETWTWHYDRAGRIIEERTFDGTILRYRHGVGGRVSRIDRPDGTWRSFVCDRRGTPLSERSSHGSISFEHDEQGRVTSAVLDEAPGKVAVRFVHDRLGRLIEETQDGLTVRYSYDERGRVASRTLPGGQTTRFSYGAADRIVRVEHEGRTLTFTYDVMGHEIRRSFQPAGVDILTERDSMDRPVRRLVMGPPDAKGSRPALVDRAMSYDAAGRPVSVRDAAGGVTFEHDAAGRLTGARRGRVYERYEHDAAGSVIGATFHGEPPRTPWVTRPGNVLVRAGDVDFEVDELRRRTRRTAPGRDGRPESTQYLWDCRDRLREVRFADGRRAVYTYDAFGRRLRKDLYPPLDLADPETAKPVRTVRYVWQNSSLAAEIDSLGQTRVFVHGPGSFLPLLQEQGGEVLAYVCDAVGTPEELIDERGAVAWRSSHSAWGAPLPGAAPSRVQTPFRLLGQYADEETGLSSCRHRYFDPEAVRWLSADPLGLPGGSNAFGFNGSPVMHADPLGLRCLIGNVLGDPVFSYVAASPPHPSYFDVAVHGYPDRVVVYPPGGGERSFTPQQLAAWIRTIPEAQGRPIRLVSCHTGAQPNGFASQFQQAMGVPVLAPTNVVRPTPYGPGGFVIDPGRWDPATNRNNGDTPGAWVPFGPPLGASPPPTTPAPPPAVNP